jgi:uncharacterized membrane protein YhaH (DUF805 family)
MARVGSFDGRLPRRAFWLASLGLWLAFALLFALLEAALGRAATLLLYPPFFFGLAVLLVRRLHDRGRSGRALWALLVPLLGPLWIAVETALRRGTPGDNRYGRDPLTPPDHLAVA